LTGYKLISELIKFNLRQKKMMVQKIIKGANVGDIIIR